MKILIVEDDNDIMTPLLLLTSYLLGDEDEVVPARWYLEAVDAIQMQGPFDLVFLDHDIPNDDPASTMTWARGYDLIPLIREYHPRAVVYGTSALGDRAPQHPLLDCYTQKGKIHEVIARVCSAR
jgi:CheY-like chemotaxis protein